MSMNETDALKALVGSEELFVLISRCTNLPFVMCDPETFDDEVFVFENAEDAKTEGARLTEKQNPVMITKLSKGLLLTFYSNLVTMGANCVLLNSNTDRECRIQLDRIVKKPGKTMPNGEPWIENPALHLTALYFMQELRGQKLTEIPDSIKELRDEIIAHYSQGTFLTVLNEQGAHPIVTYPNGDKYMPIFTDLFEATKFKVDQKPRLVAIQAVKIPTILSTEVKGVVVNPNSVNLQLPITRTAVNPDDILKK